MLVMLSRLYVLFVNYISRDLDNTKILLYKLFFRYLVVKAACVKSALVTAHYPNSISDNHTQDNNDNTNKHQLQTNTILLALLLYCIVIAHFAKHKETQFDFLLFTLSSTRILFAKKQV